MKTFKEFLNEATDSTKIRKQIEDIIKDNSFELSGANIELFDEPSGNMSGRVLLTNIEAKKSKVKTLIKSAFKGVSEYEYKAEDSETARITFK